MNPEQYLKFIESLGELAQVLTTTRDQFVSMGWDQDNAEKLVIAVISAQANAQKAAGE